MPDFAPNFTFRYRVKYSVGGHTHRMQVRGVPATTTAALGSFATAIEDFLNALTANRYSDFVVLGADYALADSDVFLPCVAPAPDAGTYTIAGRSASSNALALSFPGRSDVGLRAILFLYGTALLPGVISEVSDFRITSAEDATIAAAIAVLAGSPPVLVANDGVHVNWYPYCNVKYNDYWVRKTRT